MFHNRRKPPSPHPIYASSMGFRNSRIATVTGHGQGVWWEVWTHTCVMRPDLESHDEMSDIATRFLDQLISDVLSYLEKIEVCQLSVISLGPSLGGMGLPMRGLGRNLSYISCLCSLQSLNQSLIQSNLNKHSIQHVSVSSLKRSTFR